MAQVFRLFVTLVALASLLGGSTEALARRSSVTSRASASKALRTRKIHQQVQRDGLRTSAVNKPFTSRHRTNYSVRVPETPIRDQYKSGRCWTYAWTKTLQTMAMQKGGKPGKLSASFINYHALRTQAYGAINHALRGAEKPEHHLYYLDGDMVGEGGYAHWANQIVKKYGMVPEEKMSSNTFDARESHLLQNKLHRIVTAAYRDIWNTSTGAKKKRRAIARKYKKQVDQLLKTMIGAPPRRFTVEVDGKKETYTPQTYRKNFLKLADNDLEFVQLTHDPTRAWNRRYRESFYGKGIPENESYNVSMSTIQRAVKKTLKKGVAVNVAVNVDWDNPHRVANRDHKSSKTNGILSLRAFGYDKLVPTPKLSKRERMEHSVSLSNHMMAITGYQPGRGNRQARWLIDNSHDAKHFRKGRFDMYNDFFKHYVEEVTVPKSALPKALLRKLESKPALDTIGGMNIPPSRGGTRWTPTRKRALVEVVLREELSVAEAAKRYSLPPKRVQGWVDGARKAMLGSLR
jgi:bleomycin hydrolase